MVIPECGWQHMHQDDLGIKMFRDGTAKRAACPARSEKIDRQ
jgi:hypothetical protein